MILNLKALFKAWFSYFIPYFCSHIFLPLTSIHLSVTHSAAVCPCDSEVAYALCAGWCVLIILFTLFLLSSLSPLPLSLSKVDSSVVDCPASWSWYVETDLVKCFGTYKPEAYAVRSVVFTVHLAILEGILSYPVSEWRCLVPSVCMCVLQD